MAHVERLRVYPVKGLDGIEVESSEILSGGTLANDREFALFDDEGEVLNGKRTARIHTLSTDYDPATQQLTVATPSGETHIFGLEDERDRASEWFSDFFGTDLTLERDRSLGFVDRREMGPSVVSTATLRTVASWFDGMTVDGARRRLRANVEIGDVPAFWEDRLVGDGPSAFLADGVRFEGITPCGRCVVPSRDPDTGDPLPEFQEQFVEKRRETFPEWADEGAFDHFFSLMVITSVPEDYREQSVRVGTPVSVP